MPTNNALAVALLVAVKRLMWQRGRPRCQPRVRFQSQCFPEHRALSRLSGAPRRRKSRYRNDQSDIRESISQSASRSANGRVSGATSEQFRKHLLLTSMSSTCPKTFPFRAVVKEPARRCSTHVLPKHSFVFTTNTRCHETSITYNLQVCARE